MSTYTPSFIGSWWLPGGCLEQLIEPLRLFFNGIAEITIGCFIFFAFNLCTESGAISTLFFFLNKYVDIFILKCTLRIAEVLYVSYNKSNKSCLLLDRPIHLSSFKELAIKVVAPTKKVGAFFCIKTYTKMATLFA